MNTIKIAFAAAAIVAAMATPGAARSTSEQIWDQINQTVPHRPSSDADKDAVPNRISGDEFKDPVPNRPSSDEFKTPLP